MSPPRTSLWQLGLLTTLALVAFAMNSILCREALRTGGLDPASFTALRLGSGVFCLWGLLVLRGRKDPARAERGGHPVAAGALFVYAAAFSWSYLELTAATGALILFAFVQATMIVAGLVAGDRPHAIEWAGWLLAVLGLAWLLAPGVEAPPVRGSLLMAVAGVAWGVYSLRGRGERHPIAATRSNFTRALPLALVPLVFVPIEGDGRGVLWAVLSGAVTSGLGYVVWYAVLPRWTALQAALLQLLVPLIAALLGSLLLAETPGMRLLIASLLLLGGVAVALVGKRRR